MRVGVVVLAVIPGGTAAGRQRSGGEWWTFG